MDLFLPINNSLQKQGGDWLSVATLVKEHGSNHQPVLDFLKLFGLIEEKRENGQHLIRYISEKAQYCGQSISDLIENGIPVVENWNDIDLFPSKELNIANGNSLLYALEKRRLEKIKNPKTFKNMNLIILIIKAKTNDDTERYLVQYHTKTFEYKFIGGSRKFDDLEKDTLYFLNKELSRQKFTAKDVKITHLEDIFTQHLSRKFSILTSYKISLCSVTLNFEKLKLSKYDSWVTIDELLKGKTEVTNVHILSHLRGLSSKDPLVGVMKNLPLSLRAPQETPPTFFNNAPDSENISSYIFSLLSQDESETLEFKSSLRWDHNFNKLNKDLERVIVKTIAGFLNGSGGTLLLGASDDKSIVGIEKDFFTLKKRDNDGFMQHIINLVTSHVGAQFADRINFLFATIHDKTLCAINIKKAQEPIFIKDNALKTFYVRLSNSTRQLDVEETYKYIRFHW